MKSVKSVAPGSVCGVASLADPVSDRFLRLGFLVMVSLALGGLVLWIGGLPLRWGVTVLACLLLPATAFIAPAPRRFLEAGLMLSLAANIDFHIGNDLTHLVEPTGIPVSITGLLACVLGVLWFIDRGVERPRHSLFGGLGFPILGLWITSTWSIVGAPEPRFGIYSLVNLGYFTLLFLYLANTVSTRDHLRSLLGWLMVAIGLTSLVALAEYAFDQTNSLAILGMLSEDKLQTLASSDLVRVGGLLGSSNALAWALAQTLPLMLAFFLAPKAGYQRLVLIGGLGAGIVALVSTYSRGGWLAFTIAVMVVLLLKVTHRPNHVREGWVRKLALSAFLLALVVAPLYGNIYTRLTEDDRGAAHDRIPMMKVALRMIEDNPIFGVGLGNYENVMREYDDGPERIHQYFPWPVHNIFLHITAEVGLIGGLCFLLLALFAVRQGLRAIRTPDPFLRAAAIALVAGLMAYLIVGMKELGSLGSGRLFWVGIALLVATRRVAERQQLNAS